MRLLNFLKKIEEENGGGAGMGGATTTANIATFAQKIPGGPTRRGALKNWKKSKKKRMFPI
ncbi:MAG TPA: hypothetical protein P5293_06895 [Bacteroidales bacterium]|nr:hypothetical protein [Bacteroidales bacterium]